MEKKYKLPTVTVEEAAEIEQTLIAGIEHRRQK